MHKVALPGISAVLLLIFGSGILYSSIYSVNRSLTNQASGRLCAKEWYWSDQLLPDHPLYPALMVRDKISLWAAPDDQRQRRQLLYAQERLDSARQLAAKGNMDLAVSTLSKSQLYLLTVAKDSREDHFKHVLPGEIGKALETSLSDISALITQYPQLNAPVVQSLLGAGQSELSLIQKVALESSKPGAL